MYDTSLWLGGKEFKSRLIVGTGKYSSFENMREAIEASGAEMVTVAVRRVSLPGQGEPSLLDYIDPAKYTLLPNTAGCYTADEAVRTCYLAREAGLGSLVKLEVIGDSRTLFPDALGLLEATRTLAREGFTVLPYTNDDPVMAKKLEDAGAAAVMPLGAPIGSGLGIRNPYNIKIILETVTVPVIVDAGVGTASDAALAMELGVDGVLMNTAIAGREGPGGDGHGDEARRRGWPARVQGGAHRKEALRNRVVAARGRAGLDELTRALLDFALYLVTDRRAARRPLVEVVDACLGAGLRAIQLREKDLGVRDLLDLGVPLRDSTRRHGARLVINDRADVALAIGADGVQRTHDSLPVSALRRIAPRPFLIGASVHGEGEAREAAADGADFLVFGPVYETPSKRQYGAPQGLAALEKVAASVACPVLAIGGITPERVPEVSRAGAAGVGVISAIVAADRPADATKAFLDALGRA